MRPRATLPPAPAATRASSTSVLDLVGDTPLFELRRLDGETPRGRVLRQGRAA